MKLDVLDHGYVKLIDVMGNDNSPLVAARMSTDNETGVDVERDDKLREFLWSAGHVSPFHFATMVFEIKCPIFVARQIMRHTALKFNEFSQRYSEAIPEYYLPSVKNIKPQSKTNHQMSEGELDEGVVDETQEVFDETFDIISANYEWMIDNGVARETARFVQPVSNYTKLMMVGNLRDILFMLKQRLAEDAQYETRIYAQAIAQMVQEKFPKTYQVFEKHTLNAVNLTEDDAQLIAKYLLASGFVFSEKMTKIMKKLGGN